MLVPHTTAGCLEGVLNYCFLVKLNIKDKANDDLWCILKILSSLSKSELIEGYGLDVN